MVNVRYLVDDVEAAIAWYTTHLGFSVLTSYPPAFADVKRGALRLLLSGPTSSAGRPMADGEQPGPGGWNRIHLIVEDLPAEVARLKGEGVKFRNDVVSGPGGSQVRKIFRVELSDLIAASVLTSGIHLVPRRKKHADRIATLLPDGRVEIDGTAFSNPSEAATKIAGKQTGGWWFFLVDPASRRSLRDVRNEDVRAMSLEAEDDEEDGEEDED